MTAEIPNGELEDNSNIVLNSPNPDTEAVPEDIENFLNELGIKDRKYTCHIKRAPQSGGLPEHLPGSFLGEYPDINELGRKFGPGKYYYCFKYLIVKPDGSRKQTTKEFMVVLGDEWAELCEEYHAEKYIERENKLDTLSRKARMKKALRGQPTENNNTDGVDGLIKATDVLKTLGVPIGVNNNLPAKQNDNSLVAMLGLISTMQQNATQMQMKMMEATNNNMVQLMAALIAKPEGKNQFMEALNVMREMVDIKLNLTPQKEDTVDKVFKLLEGVLPMLSQMAALKAAERAKITKPLVSKAKESKEYNEIANDENMLRALIERMDSVHGAENTNTILETMGWQRPADMPGGTPLEQAQEEIDKEIQDSGDRPD